MHTTRLTPTGRKRRTRKRINRAQIRDPYDRSPATARRLKTKTRRRLTPAQRARAKPTLWWEVTTANGTHMLVNGYSIAPNPDPLAVANDALSRGLDREPTAKGLRVRLTDVKGQPTIYVFDDKKRKLRRLRSWVKTRK